MPKRVMLEGVALCSPFVQGHLDCICGLYAAVNALALVAAPIRPLQRDEARELIRIGAEYLQRRQELCDALNFGMEVDRQVEVALHMLKQAERVTGLPITASTPFRGKGRRQGGPSIKALEKKLASGTALMVFLANTLDHYTVVCGVTARRVYLFDSDGNHWLERSAIGMDGRRLGVRHYVPAESIIEVRREERKRRSTTVRQETIARQSG